MFETLFTRGKTFYTSHKQTVNYCATHGGLILVAYYLGKSRGRTTVLVGVAPKDFADTIESSVRIVSRTKR